MTARIHVRGHPAELRDGAWVFSDTGKSIAIDRPCARCNRLPTPEGYDVCLGEVPGAQSACCGHGAEPGYIYIDGKRVEIGTMGTHPQNVSSTAPHCLFLEPPGAREMRRPGI